MKLNRRYERKRFKPAAIKAVRGRLETLYPDAEWSSVHTYSLDRVNDSWTFDSPDDFYAAYGDGRFRRGIFMCSRSSRSLSVWLFDGSTTVAITADSYEHVMAIMAVWEEHLDDAYEIAPPPKPPPRIFIGHGRSSQWRDLKDFLHEKHDYAVQAFETAARAGHVTRDVLEQMLNDSAFAFLVLTGEDETADGQLRARQNVVHEAGLFQGKLGFPKVVLIVEDGVESFSNMAGIQEIRFSKGNIRETFGDVLSTLRASLQG